MASRKFVNPVFDFEYDLRNEENTASNEGLLQASQNFEESTLSDDELLQASQSFEKEHASTSAAEITVARKQPRCFV